MEENSLPGIVLTLIVHKPDLELFFCMRSIRINTVVIKPWELLRVETQNLHHNLKASKLVDTGRCKFGLLLYGNLYVNK